MGFPEKVHRTAKSYGMDLRRPLALVSGGPDSVALLRVILALGGEPVVLHVDHGLRGEESRGDAEFVRDLCVRLGVHCEVRRLGLDGSSNLQERARDERYRLAEEVAVRLGLRAVATGHTADDVAETVLMNLARGTGLRGLAGIPPVRGRIERPLIGRTRQEILNYLNEIDQPYRTDPTNLTGKYARNRVRLEVLPVLEELYPGAAGNIARAPATRGAPGVHDVGSGCRVAPFESGRGCAWTLGGGRGYADIGPAGWGSRLGPLRGGAGILHRVAVGGLGAQGDQGRGDRGVRGVEDLGAGALWLRSWGCGAGRGRLPRRQKGAVRGADGQGGGYYPAVGPRWYQEGLEGDDGQEGTE